MGFGPLLVGYILLLNPGVYDAFSGIIAYSLMLYGMATLRVYYKRLHIAFYAAAALTVFGLVRFGCVGYAFLGFGTLSTVAESVFAVLAKVLTFVFTWFLLGGITDLGNETKIPEIVRGAAVGRILSAVYYFLAMALEITALSPEAAVAAANAVIPVMLFGFVVIGLNAFTIFRCLRWICLPEDKPEDESDNNDSQK